MKIIRILYKFIALLLLLLIGVLSMLWLTVFSKNHTGHISQKQKNLRKKWLQKVIAVVGVHLKIEGDKPDDEHHALWVANHVSWLDIPVIGSAGVGFLSKAEVRQWPVIGWLGEKSGTVFIKRGGKDASKNASREIAEKIKSDDSILVFPEGTTGNGDTVKRFHARIFAPALDHQIAVQPIAIQYLDNQGNHFHEAAWVNESFFSHLFRILGESRLDVVVTFLPVLASVDFQHRRALAENAERLIKDVVVLP